MFKQSFKNLRYCCLMSDIVKDSFFWRQRATLYNGKVANVLFSFPAGEHTVHRRLHFKKIGKWDGGITPDFWALVRLDGWWFRQESFQLTKEVINFNAMHILNSFRVRSLLSNFLYTIKKIDKSKIEQIKKQTEIKSNRRSTINLARWL